MRGAGTKGSGISYRRQLRGGQDKEIRLASLSSWPKRIRLTPKRLCCFTATELPKNKTWMSKFWAVEQSCSFRTSKKYFDYSHVKFSSHQSYRGIFIASFFRGLLTSR